MQQKRECAVFEGAVDSCLRIAHPEHAQDQARQNEQGQTQADEATESTIEFGEEEDIESTTILPDMEEELTTIQPKDELDEDIDETTVPVIMTMDTTTSTFSPMLDQETTSIMVEEAPSRVKETGLGTEQIMEL